jgi:TP901 family phage tail tape measure protein
MAGRYSIETVFRLIDQISAPLDKVAGKGNKVGKVLKRDFMAAQDTVDNFGKSLKKIGGYAAAAGIGAIGVGLGIATKQFIDFDASLHKSGAAFNDISARAPDFKDKLQEIGKAARKVAAETEFDAVQTANALTVMAQAGLDSSSAIGLLAKTADLATAAQIDLDTATGMAVNSLNVFGLMTKDTEQLGKNLEYISDQMRLTADLAVLDFNQVYETATMVGGRFTQANQSIENLGGMIATLANLGKTGSEAGNALSSMMSRLAAPPKAAAAALSELGIQTQDSFGNLRNVVDILEEIGKKTAGMGTAKTIGYIKNIFGGNYDKVLDPLIRNIDMVRELTGELQKASGATELAAETMRMSLENRIAVLKSSVTELGFKFVEAFKDKGADLVEKLIDAVSNFDPQPIIDAVVTVGNVIEDIIKIIWNLRFFILGAAIAWGIYEAAHLSAALVTKLKILDMIKSIVTLMATQKGMNVVQATFNTLLKTNPVGLIITAIGLLIGLFILAYQKCEPFRNMVNGVLEKLKSLGAHIIQVLSPAFEVIKGVVQKVITVLGTIISTVMRVISLFFGLFNITNQTAGSFSFFDIILQGFSTGVQVVWTLLGGLVDTVGALFEGINNVISAFQNGGFIAGIKQIGLSLLNFLLTPIKAVLEAVSFLPGIGGLAKRGAEKIAQFQDFLSAETEKNTGLKNNPAEAATSTVKAASPPVDAWSPGASIVPPGVSNPAAGTPAECSAAIRQPALLNIREGRLFSAGPVQSPAMAPVAASSWNVPVEPDLANFDAQAALVTQSPAASPVPAPLAQAVSRTVEAVSVLVKYDFPEMIVPPELVRPVSVPVSWVYPPPPEAPFTTTAAPASRFRPPWAATGHIVHPAIANSDPARVDRIVPPAAGYPVSPSIRAALVPPASPMTRAEQMAAEQVLYSRTENYEKIDLEISLDKGLEARVVNPPKSPNVKLEISGAV